MKTIILGLDAFDPETFETLSGGGKLPSLTTLAEQGDYAPFAVSNPPQSEVSWTSIATGLSPAGHGMFDFVHRNPKSYNLFVSLLPTQKTALGTQFAQPFNSHTIFNEAVQQGYPATSFWWPATFPARMGSPVRNIPGLGTPDIHGRLGVGVAFAMEADDSAGRKIPIHALSKEGEGTFSGSLPGPSKKDKASSIEFQLQFQDEDHARLDIGKSSVDLARGTWSPIIELKFKMGFLVSVKAITRMILTEGQSSPRLYVMPLQIHPLRPLWPYAAPRGFVKETWNVSEGGFLSLGWPQDTTALEEGHVNDEQFLALCTQIRETRKRIFWHNLDDYKEGILASVFDSLDRVQHMFLHDRPDIVEEWYINLDKFVGRVMECVDARSDKTQLLVVSDHGFAKFDHKVHVNRWLVEQGYLVTDGDPHQDGSLSEAQWPQSEAYAVGLTSLYLNLKGREGQGAVEPSEKDAKIEEIRQKMLQWEGPDGKNVLRAVKLSSEVYDDVSSPHAPDLLLGFADGYRASAETGLGKWGPEAIVTNEDHWHADHCIDADLVSGVIFSNQGFKGISDPSYRDFPQLAIGMTPKKETSSSGPELKDEDQADIEERLKGLGYL